MKHIQGNSHNYEGTEKVDTLGNNEVALACSLRYLTTNNCHVPDKSIGVYSYHEKQPTTSKQTPAVGKYYSAKKSFVTSRGESWFVSNKRPEYFRENLLDVEKNLKFKDVVATASNSPYFQILLNNGLIITFLINDLLGIEKFYVDSTLVKTVTNEYGNVVSGVIAKDFMVFTSDSKNNLFFVTFNPNKSNMKLSSADMKISYLAIPGPPSNRKVIRNICINKTMDLAVCWCSLYKSSTAWTPTTNDYERANFVLLACNHQRLDILNFIATEHDPTFVQFSNINTRQIFTVEKCPSTNRNSYTVSVAVYEAIRSKIQRIQTIEIPLKSGVLSCALNNAEDKLIIGCSNGSLVLHDLVAKVTTVTHDSLVPTILQWHPHGGAILACSGSGDMRCYDSALTRLPCTFMEGDDVKPNKEFVQLSQCLTNGNGLANLTWVSDDTSQAFLIFDGGPCALMKLHTGVPRSLRPLDVVQEYTKTKQINHAIKVLCSMNWNTHSLDTFAALTTIFNDTIKQKLNHQREEQLEATLGSFYVPKYTISDAVVVEYRHAISRYSRRFFFHLLRYSRFHKAMLLATDLQSKDLFMDLYFVARKYGEIDIARAAKRKAYELTESDSELDDSTESSSDYEEDIINKEREHHSISMKPRATKPPMYPALKVDDFMNTLMKEAQAVAAEQSENGESDTSSVEETTSTLKVLHLGYV